MARIDGVLKGFAAFLLLAASLFYAYASYGPSLSPEASGAKTIGKSQAEPSFRTGQELPASEGKSAGKEAGRTAVASSEGRRKAARSQGSFSKSDIVRKTVVFESKASSEEIVRTVKKELRSVYREVRSKNSPFLLGYLIIRDRDGREMGRGVIRPDSTYVIVVEGKIVKEGSVNEL